MAFLDSSTAVIDAILTRKGRELLARNDGSFQITKFAFGDDEINYQLVLWYVIFIGQYIKISYCYFLFSCCGELPYSFVPVNMANNCTKQLLYRNKYNMSINI